MDSRFNFSETSLKGLNIIQHIPFHDKRGYLERLYCSEELTHLLTNDNIVQINHTLTRRKGTVRGMHFQHPPDAETKIIRCLRGRIYDVAVDIRNSSPTFLKWHCEILSADDHKSILIPPGFAHGFQTMTDNCDLIYFHTNKFNPQAEDGIYAQDRMLDIKWPLPVSELSERDCNHVRLSSSYSGVVL